LDARMAKSEIVLFNKLLLAKRFHASFKVIGTLSSRMSGGDDLNAQGIKRAKYIRECFPLSRKGEILCGGDFDSFEVVLADATYNDPALREALLSGKKIHALFGMEVYPGMTYEQIMHDKEKYTRSKSAVFAMLYGGEAHTLKTRLGINIEDAEKAYQRFIRKYKQVGEERKKIFKQFCSMVQPGGIGTKVEWHDPSDYIESLFGFRRYFTLENKVCKALFEMANRPPKNWVAYKAKVTRRDRVQTVSGAVQSALYAAAFAIQASSMRAAANHVIQSSGAQITKAVQCAIWELQPQGINPWKVQPMNIHDEIMCPVASNNTENENNTILQVKQKVDSCVESYKTRVPLIKMEWNIGLQSWADK
jgi:DNA polymerase I-like protein with 3'-5' exonuclease and polymerase domains